MIEMTKPSVAMLQRVFCADLPLGSFFKGGFGWCEGCWGMRTANGRPYGVSMYPVGRDVLGAPCP